MLLSHFSHECGAACLLVFKDLASSGLFGLLVADTLHRSGLLVAQIWQIGGNRSCAIIQFGTWAE